MVDGIFSGKQRRNLPDLILFKLNTIILLSKIGRLLCLLRQPYQNHKQETATRPLFIPSELIDDFPVAEFFSAEIPLSLTLPTNSCTEGFIRSHLSSFPSKLRLKKIIKIKNY
jgi:hypothetical protein